jgi:putative endonuclease
MANNSRQALGRFGEDIAAHYLTDQGWTVLDRNWRCREGELDLIAQPQPGTVVFVEVKTRSGARFGSPAAAVTPRKLARLRRLAGAWLREHPGDYRFLRIDVIAVTSGAKLGRSVDHIEGVSL